MKTLPEIKAQLAAIIAAEGVTPGPWITGSIPWKVWADGGYKTICDVRSAGDEVPVGNGLALSNAMARNRDFIAASRTLCPELAKWILKEIEWLEVELIHAHPMWAYKFRDRLDQICAERPHE